MTEVSTFSSPSSRVALWDRPLETPLLARPWVEKAFVRTAETLIALALLTVLVLVCDVLVDGVTRLNWQFLTSYPSRKPEAAGILAALMGSVYLILLTVLFSLPIAVGAALYLEEYAVKNRITKFIEVCIMNLAGVPSIIYGLLGLQVFVRVCQFERSILSGALTLTLLVLPVIIIAAREAIRTVPRSYRDGAIALGATRWQTCWTQVIPSALPGVLTGCILAYSRALGETAPLIMLGALTYVARVPDSLFAPFTALPIQSFNWISRPQPAFHANAAAGITVLLVVMLSLNAVAIVIRAKLQKRQK